MTACKCYNKQTEAISPLNVYLHAGRNIYKQ